MDRQPADRDGWGAAALAVLAQRLQGEARQAALNRLLELVEAHPSSHSYNIDSPSSTHWKQQFPAAATQAFESAATSHAKQERVAELERMVGKLVGLQRRVKKRKTHTTNSDHPFRR